MRNKIIFGKITKLLVFLGIKIAEMAFLGLYKQSSLKVRESRLSDTVGKEILFYDVLYCTSMTLLVYNKVIDL